MFMSQVAYYYRYRYLMNQKLGFEGSDEKDEQLHEKLLEVRAQYTINALAFISIIYHL